MKNFVLLIALMLGLAGSAAAQCGPYYNNRPQVNLSVGNGWGGGTQWGINVGTGYNVPVAYPAYPTYYYPQQVPVVRYPVYNTYPVYNNCPQPYYNYNAGCNTRNYYNNGYGYNRGRGNGWGRRNRCR